MVNSCLIKDVKGAYTEILFKYAPNLLLLFRKKYTDGYYHDR